MVATKTSRTLRVPPDSELGVVLREAKDTGASIVVDTGEAVYRLGFEPGASDEVSPLRRERTPEEIERSQEGIRRSIGSWRDFDAEGFKAYIRERRLTKNRPSVKL